MPSTSASFRRAHGMRPTDIEPGRPVVNDWDRELTETWVQRKARLSAARAALLAERPTEYFALKRPNVAGEVVFTERRGWISQAPDSYATRPRVWASAAAALQFARQVLRIRDAYAVPVDVQGLPITPVWAAGDQSLSQPRPGAGSSEKQA